MTLVDNEGGGTGTTGPTDGSGASAEELLRELARLPAGSSRAARVRERVAGLYTGQVSREARRYRNRGVPDDDLRQVAALGLMKAIQRFDPGHGTRFLSYLLPMMTGELKRYFRDSTWAVRAPRAQQERRAELKRFTGEFAQQNGRAPTQAEIGAHMGLDTRETGEMINACSAYAALSLDRPVGEDDGERETVLADRIGADDRDLELVVDREALAVELRRLPEREQRIVLLRFFGDRTQAEIARTMGCSQMHVSRLLSRTLALLRHRLNPEPAL